MNGSNAARHGAARSLALTPTARRQLNALSLGGYPHEVCGLLVGQSDGMRTRVVRVVPAANAAGERRRDRYRLDPAAFRRADEEARRDGFDVVGIWHTHPDHPARPSETDLALAWPAYSYLIVSVREQGVVDAASWRLDGDRFVREALQEVAA